MIDGTNRNTGPVVGTTCLIAGWLLVIGAIAVEGRIDGRMVGDRPSTSLILRAVRVAELPVRRAASEHFVMAWTERELTGDDSGDPAAGLAGRPELPRAWALAQNYPNPFNPSTTIAFEIPGGIETGGPEAGGAGVGLTHVALAVYDVRGRRVRTLIDADLEPGRHAIAWDGRNDRGGKIASGIYLYTLRAGSRTFTRKMSLSK